MDDSAQWVYVIDDQHTKGTGGVDATAREGHEDDVRQKDGKTNGEGGHVGDTLGEGLLVHRRHDDARAQDERAHEFQQESVAFVEGRVETVGAESKGRIAHQGAICMQVTDGRPQQETAERGPAQLRDNVGRHLHGFTLANQKEAKGDGRVEVSARNVTKRIGLHENTNAKGKGNRQDTRDTCGRRGGTAGELFAGRNRRARANVDKERHAEEFGNRAAHEFLRVHHGEVGA